MEPHPFQTGANTPKKNFNQQLFVMKRWPTTMITQNTIITLANPADVEQPAMADSLEVIEGYYHEKIQVLEYSLEQLNLQENAREITFMCREIKATRVALERIIRRKSYVTTN